MLCSSCIHYILRTYFYNLERKVVVICDIDGAVIGVGLNECSRFKYFKEKEEEAVEDLAIKRKSIIENWKKKRGNPNWVKK